MTELIERYRRNAEKCVELAKTLNDLDAKRALLDMAIVWLKFVEQHVNEQRDTDRPRPNVDRE